MLGVMLGLRAPLGSRWGYIGVMETKMEITI